MDIVWIHGFGENSFVWEDFTPRIKGNSFCFDHSDLTEASTMQDYVNALAAFLDFNALKNPVLVGHSMGGYIALAYAALFPIAGLGLFHSSASADSDAKKAERDKTRKFIADHGSGAFIRNFFPKMFSEGFQEREKDFIHRQVNSYSQISAEALMGATQAMKNREDHVQSLEKFAFPVFQILGKDDPFVPLDLALNQTVLLQKPSALVLEGVAHAGMYEAPQICAAFINHFLRQNTFLPS